MSDHDCTELADEGCPICDRAVRKRRKRKMTRLEADAIASVALDAGDTRPEIDLDALDKKAAAATSGQWEKVVERGTDNFNHSIYGPAGDYKALLIARVDQQASYANADYIVAMSPDVCRQLIARLKAAEEKLQGYDNAYFIRLEVIGE